MDTSSDEEDMILLMYLHLRKRKRRRQKRTYGLHPLKKRTYYVHPLNQTRGEFHDMRTVNDMEYHKPFFRMDKNRFDDLLRRVSPLITHKICHRWPIDAGDRLSATLRLLASGSSQKKIASLYRIGNATMNGIFYEVCDAIWTALNEEFVAFPSGETWKKIAEDNQLHWDYPLCIGTVAAKRVAVKTPSVSGSVIFMAVVDARYRFTVVDIGSYRKESGGVFNQSKLGKMLEDGTANLPKPGVLPGTDTACDYHLVGGDTFPLKTYLMRPYPGRDLPPENRKFNDHLTPILRSSENAFGILSARWRVFKKPIEARPKNIDKIILATVALHNFLCSTDDNVTPTPATTRYIPQGFVDSVNEDGQLVPGSWRKIVEGDRNLEPIGKMGANMFTRNAKATREKICDYLSREEDNVKREEPEDNDEDIEGSLPSQETVIGCELDHVKTNVPISCCIKGDDSEKVAVCQEEALGYNYTTARSFIVLKPKGCFSTLLDILNSNLALILGVIGGVAFIELMGIVLGLCMCCNTRGYSFKNAKKGKLPAARPSLGAMASRTASRAASRSASRSASRAPSQAASMVKTRSQNWS